MITEFKNLYDFFSYAEFCPLCEKRLSYTAILPIATSSILNGQRFIVYSSLNGEKILDIDLVDNSFCISTPPPPYVNIFTNTIHLQIRQQCRKYHYQHIGSVFLHIGTKTINLIQLDRKHLHEQVNNSHFAIAVSYGNRNETSVKITPCGSKTKEVTFNCSDFDLSSRKKIISRLRTIQLLG